MHPLAVAAPEYGTVPDWIAGDGTADATIFAAVAISGDHAQPGPYRPGPAAPTADGEADLIAAGRRERVRVIRTSRQKRIPAPLRS